MAEIYLVGGAVRDKLLGLPVKEKDWVVVGATSEELLAKKYLRVGKDFPVFLHPQTKEEYALARTERKVAPGYAGFEFDTSQHVTLADDLRRRDLTINAIAEDVDGNLIDPYHGIADLRQKILRHVSAAFAEDPVRILRVARFAARFAHLGFVVAAETNHLMQQMVESGEVDALVPERVWKELVQALEEQAPAMFFQVLTECNALASIFPEIAPHYRLALQNLILASKNSPAPKIRFAALMSALSGDQIQTFCQRVAVPNDYKELALLLSTYAPKLHEMTAAEHVLNLFEAIDAFRRPERWQNFVAAAQALGKQQAALNQLIHCYTLACQITAQQFIQQGLQGKALGDAIHQHRLAEIRQHLIGA